MKKNVNILDYVEKYKYKYGISYLGENVKIIKWITALNILSVIYAFFWSLITILGTLIDLKSGESFTNGGKNSFISIIFCAAIMLIVLILYCVKQNFILKMVETISLIITQFVSIVAFWHVTDDVTGLHHITAFYWRHLIPSILVIIFSSLILGLVLSVRLKTNKLYNTIVDGLYKQYGKQDGETLTEAEWENFLTEYNPYKKIADDE